MTPNQHDTQSHTRLQDDWLTALELLAPNVPAFNTYRVFTRTKLDFFTEPSHVAHIAAFKGSGPSASTFLRVNPLILTFPQVERAEFMMSFALESWKYLEEKKWEDFRKVCDRLGVDYSNSIHPRERWRLTLARGMDSTSPLWQLEDRPKCLWCEKPIPTGSDCHPVRVGVHEGCGYELDGLAKVAFKELFS